MKQLFPKRWLLPLLWLALFGRPLVAQTPTAQTADEYVRPYTESFQYGSNLGYYGQNWNDEGLATIAQQTGVHSLRPTLPEWFVEHYGYTIRQREFTRYTTDLGMKELTCFIEGPSPEHYDPVVYPGCVRNSKLFARLYDPIWNADGTVNTNNYYANYVYKLLLTYGSQVRFWEVVNEPDFADGASAAAWLTRAPTPFEQVNIQAPFYHYVRMLRITYEIVKKYRPDAYVTTSVGYPEYVDALLRYTDNPAEGAKSAAYPRTGGAYFDVLSYHSYPNYSLHYWDSSINGFRYTRTSDYAANKVVDDKAAMAAVLTKYGYDGTLHPAKLFTITESNVSRRTADDRISSDEAQRNFGIKSAVLVQKNGIRQLYYYSIGEAVDAPAVGTMVNGQQELGLMGFYENLNRDAPGATKPTQFGQALKTTSTLLYDYQYDAARTAALVLPATVDGAAFGKAGNYIYVLWAKALVDKSEAATATYSFPAAWNVGSVQRAEWDFSVTGTKATQPGQNIPLTGSPAFFTTTAGVVTPPTACTGTGSLSREQWNNISGSSVSSIPLTLAPNSSGTLTQLEAVTSTDYNYGARLRGYICPPQSGAYTFSLAGDDEAELWLSTDDQPANKVRIATSAGWTSGPRDYTRSAAQQSAAINLAAGKRYYLEVLHKQGWGTGYVSVAWRLPDGSSEAPIAGSRLLPYTAPVMPPPVLTTCAGTGSLTRELWSNVNGGTVASIPLTLAPTSTTTLNQLEGPTGQGFNYGARLRGYVCPPQSGAYTFNIVGDDEAELWLSTDELPANKARLAFCNNWTSGPRDYARYAAQQSAVINLVAGKRYYLEVLHKQAWGSDYVSVAWRLPDGSSEAPIAGSRLSLYTAPAGTAAVAAAKTTASALTAAPAPANARLSADATTELTAYPNPFSRQATVQFRLGAAGRASLAVYDVRGQLVRQLFTGTGAAGTVQRVSLDGQGLSQGIYVLRLVTDTQVLTQKLMLSK